MDVSKKVGTDVGTSIIQTGEFLFIPTVYPEISLKEVRNQRAISCKMISEGKDPLMEKKKLKAMVEKGMLLGFFHVIFKISKH